MRKLKAYAELSRPKNAFMSVLGAATGWVNSTSIYDWSFLLTCIIPPLILMAGNAVNDYFDAPVDAINKPHRPIPSGKISKREALTFYAIFSLAGVTLSSILGPLEFLIVLAFSSAWYAYARWLKRTGVPGNIIVSLGVAFTLIFGSISAGNLTMKVILFSSIAFTSNLAREFVKAVEDLPGDRTYNIRTLAVRIGIRRTGILTAVILSSVVVLTLVPMFARLVGPPYLVLSVALSLPLVGLAAFKCVQQDFGEEARSVSNMIKVTMFLGLLGM
ncbi:MAG: geranylgeranylglycerol-phosphate geranylgeranyltransferase, partial [Candidatus Korarchaeum sp.]|nr:geranylgeranylglycerol-phosphate geranylgeranyltransferase [Candidatus Korarchaeum sp.]MDW8035937.1 geranylgeranylglycerol-phosphate geranylgeranyltransferase [Candidatus Korarchaeum sp.]